jgi:ribulose-phosphate 3-epimerase
MIQIMPSILSADFSKLGKEIEVVERGGAHAIHIDVMDGHFVPNITVGPLVVMSLKSITRLPLDVHLMISDPDKFIASFVKAGADRISVHVEACTHLHRTLMLIRSMGVKCGVAINPATPLGHLAEVLSMVDFVLMMSVNPGFSGQTFINESIDKISRLHHVINSRSLKAVISVDGGVSASNAGDLVKAGARLLVAGASVFGRPDPAAAVQELIAATKLGVSA